MTLRPTLILLLILTMALGTGCTAADSINETEAERIAWEYVKESDVPSHWALESANQEHKNWIVRFAPINKMPELLWLYIDQTTGEIVKVVTDA